MKDDLSIQIFNQTTESIQKIFDLSTRIDERVKTLQANETEIKLEISDIIEELKNLQLKTNTLQNNLSDQTVNQQLQQCQLALLELDKKISNTLNDFEVRISAVEVSQQGNEDRWGKITQFTLQLIWVIIAAWVLASLGIQAPP